MARRDRTYTGADLVRFWARNCTASEQKDVLTAFAVAIALGTVREVRSKSILLMLTIISFFIPKPFGQIIRILLKFFKVTTFEEKARDFLARAERVSAEAGLTLGDLNAIVAAIEDL